MQKTGPTAIADAIYALPMPKKSPGDLLLDAHVAWLISKFSGEALVATVTEDVDALLDIGNRVNVGDLVAAEDVQALVAKLFETVPASTGGSTVVAMAADVVYDRSAERFTLTDVIDRESIERITDEVQGAAGLVEDVLDGLTNSPLVATIASRFVGRIVNDVIASNRAMAEKIPGVGPLVSMGAWSAGMVRGAADRSLDQVLGDTAAKGAVFVMRRLNKIIIETLKDSTTHDAVLEIFDLYADKPVVRLDRVASRDDVHRIADLIQDIVIAGAPAAPVLEISEALIGGFFKIYGDEPVTSLLTDLDLDRDLIVEHATSLVGGVLTGAIESGELEKLLRARLREFYASPEVAAILG